MGELILCAIIAICAFYGLLGRSNILSGHFRRATFVYYTNLSNLVIFIYMLLLCFSWFYPDHPLYTALRLPGVQFSAAMSIFITFIIFHFILAPEIRKRGTQQGISFLKQFDNLCVHYFVPLVTLAEWLFYADKTGLSFWPTLYWLSLPLAYLLFTLVRAALFGNISESGHKYPYLFIALDTLGVQKYIRNIFLLLMAFFILGCLLVGFGIVLNRII